MPLDPLARNFLERLASFAPRDPLSLSVAERRGALALLLGSTGRSEPVAAVRDHTIPGPGGALMVRTYVPCDVAGVAAAGLVYFHGGGLVAGSVHTHDGICRALAQAGGCRVLSVDYRLAPEHPFPAALDDGCAAIEYLTAHAAQFGVDADLLGICGDSAGATLAAAVCQCLAGEGRTLPALQLLLCPITDFAARSASRRAFGQGYLMDEATLAHDLRHWLPPDATASDPRVSPLRAANLHGLPPAFIHTAEYDPLRDEGGAYAEQLRRAGVVTRLTCHAGMIHMFYGMGRVIPYAAQAWERIGQEIRQCFSRLQSNKAADGHD